MSETGMPITLWTSKEMQKHAAELGVAEPLLTEKEAEAAETKAPAGVKWAPQPVSFAKLKSYRNPHHNRCIAVKARSAVGYGLVDEKLAKALPTAANGDSFLAQVLLAQLDLEYTGNGYLEIITSAGGQIAHVTWMQAETMEAGYQEGRSGVPWYRHTAIDASSKRKRVAYYPAWPAGGRAEAGTRYVLHVTQDGTWSTYYGEPDWIGALGALMLDDSAEKYQRGVFDNGCIPSYLIFLNGVKLSDEHQLDASGNELPSQRETVQRWFQAQYGGAENAGKAMLIDMPALGSDVYSEKASVQVQKLQDGPKDGDFLKLQDACRDRIISGHGVPPRLVGVVASGSLGGSGEIYGQLLLFREDVTPKRRMMEEALAQLRPKLPGTPELLFAEMDLEPFRDQQPAAALPTALTDGDVQRAAVAMLKAAAR